MQERHQHPASYRDPAGFVFKGDDGQYYRQINKEYAETYAHLMQSGLYRELIASHLLLAHEERLPVVHADVHHYKTIHPRQLVFQSFPCEWGFEQLKDAALCTLYIHQKALQKGMILKDASAYNIQFEAGRPVLMDTLSFALYNETEPWIAYRQFCEHFLYPLYLEAFTGFPVHKTFLAYPEGIPAVTIKPLLPWTSRFRSGAWLHVYLPASVARRKKVHDAVAPKTQFTRRKMEQLIAHLISVVKGLHNKTGTIWSNYYTHTISGGDYLAEKTAAIKGLLDSKKYNRVLDLGSNDGYFSRMAAAVANHVIAADSDAGCINKLYASLKEEEITSIHPILFNMAEPVPAMGFLNEERKSALERLPADMLLALALVHHLAIGSYLSFEQQARVFASLGRELIIEFVPKSDQKVQQLLLHRKDIFTHYHEQAFEQAFSDCYQIEKKITLSANQRILYYMIRK
jgi:hypothetical protein